MVQEGIAFCPQCNAPQIRVAMAEPLTSAPVSPGQEAASPSYPSYPYFGPPLVSRIDWSQALPATALAGLIAAVLMMTPLAAFGLGMLIGGSLSVVFYRRRNPSPTSLQAWVRAWDGEWGTGGLCFYCDGLLSGSHCVMSGIKSARRSSK